MADSTERPQQADEEEQASSQDFGSLTQDPEDGGDGTPTSDNDPPIISSGG